MADKKFRYKKGLGQNFLHDTVKIDRMITAIAPDPSETFLEIGPGSGNLTKKILPLVKKIFAVELDKEAIEKLKTATAGSQWLEIINADILETDVTKFFPKEGKLRVIGNIPYYITTPIIEMVINHKRHIKDIYLTVQKEVAERICAPEGSKTYGSLSVFCQYHADCEYLFTIGRKAFFPVPDVDSAFIRMNFEKKTPFTVKNETEFFKLTRGGFEQRRKMLSNNIKRVFGFNEEQAKKALRQAGIAENARAEDVSIINFAKLSDVIYNIQNIDS
ncbi:MAG TPA: 16S rRNA (adenine(1518)-N(6)/adenine(1519)-N(6))-dimethyltransferase RsmA [Candidatus Goldiibacteriota bacterium]|nr:16S rRNA (adenine(1518)-N(6)/adenine(1519)-N(6))-dimethyltransferase RsmA [Candidatus Goldiibacteriota bacterium]HPN64495.1 16S rRNA (adenine(1518)-N(6)/adenine(1519)-N(6))-dimethyltransferase RsmA [Candidatus Goldiibacteriota bacterium]HRQ44346.1 16S rRNA (adenine(1518)-N(6)/adenine(1519)-N(6))-dimethyltransferase RsmA [Candidatus Goldiibacteriota bacterium]